MMIRKTRLLTAGIATIVLLAAALFVVPLTYRSAVAQAWTGDVAENFGGGTDGDPYIISSGDHLKG